MLSSSSFSWFMLGILCGSFPSFWVNQFVSVSCWILLSVSICDKLAAESEKAMAPHSSTLAWKIPWTEEPGRLQSMGSWRVGHDWMTSLSLFTFLHWRRKWQPTPVFLPGESRPSMGSHRVRHDWSDLAACHHQGPPHHEENRRQHTGIHCGGQGQQAPNRTGCDEALWHWHG